MAYDFFKKGACLTPIMRHLLANRSGARTLQRSVCQILLRRTIEHGDCTAEAADLKINIAVRLYKTVKRLFVMSPMGLPSAPSCGGFSSLSAGRLTHRILMLVLSRASHHPLLKIGEALVQLQMFRGASTSVVEI